MRKLTTFIFLISALSIFAQEAELVKDIDPSSSGESFDPDNGAVEWNNLLFFNALTSSDGREPWVTDGSEEGTFILRDIRRGTRSSDPRDFTATEMGVFFVATGELGDELYITDGTIGGTKIVKDINPGEESSGITMIYPLGNQILFAANSDLTEERALWLSDGTEEGTNLFYDVNPGNTLNTNFGDYVNGKLVFPMSAPTSDREPWVTDGTIEGTFPLFEGTNRPSNFTETFVHGDIMYFTAWTSARGTELYKTDGTVEGSSFVKDIYWGTTASSPKDFVVLNDEVYFSARSENLRQVWKTDGTEEGTIEISDIDGDAVWLGGLTVIGDQIFFKSPSTTYGQELWVTDGTSEGTSLFADINPDGDGEVDYLHEFNGDLYFSADDGDNGEELWKMDGETQELTSFDLMPGAGDSSPLSFHDFGDQLFFVADDGEGNEPWVTDGTVEGTNMLADINPTASSVNTNFMYILNQELLFVGITESSDKQIWKTNGTPEGTAPLTNIRSQNYQRIRDLTVFDNLLFFNADDGLHGQELWVSDGTEEGTFMHADVAEGSGGSVVLNILTTNDQLFFYAYGAEGRNLYHMNSAQEAPSVVKDIWPGEDDDVQFVVKVGDEVYFRADDTDGFGQGNDLWKSDGTEEGTVKVKDWGSSAANPEGFFGTDDRVYFQMEEYGTTSQWGIYSSDGTEDATLQLAQHNFSANGSASFQFIEINDGIIYLPGGTLGREPYFANDEGAGLIKTIYPGSPSPYIINMIDYEGVVYFVADDGSNGDELWRTDGTFDGTYRVIDLAVGESRGALNFRDLISNSSATVGRVDNGMVFGGQTGDGDYELYFSDGTAEGTSLLLDINPNGSSNPYNFYYGENYTYFTAQDGVHGYELWRTDGTPDGTSLVADVAEGASSSSPEDFIEKDGYLYFTASTPYFYKDLFRIDQRCIVPEISLSETTVCTDQEINFEASVVSIEGELESSNWSFGDNNSSELINSVHAYSQAGDYTAELILLNNNGCSYTESMDISVLAQPITSIESETDPLCLSSEWNPQNTSTPNLFYTWDFGTAGTSDLENPAVQFTEIGTYQISLEVSNGSCSNSFNTMVEVYSPIIELISVVSPVCPSDITGEIEVNASSDQGSMVYSLNDGTFFPSSVFTELGIGEYTIYAQDAGSCIVALEVELEGPEEIDLSATINEDDGTGIGSIQISAVGGTPPYEFSIDGGSDNDTGLFENLLSDFYNIGISDVNGCTFSEEFFVESSISINETAALSSFKFFPNPNNGNLQIQFEQKSTEIITVFDTTGKQVATFTVKQGINQVNLTHLESGLYIMKSRENMNVGTLIIQH